MFVEPDFFYLVIIIELNLDLNYLENYHGKSRTKLEAVCQNISNK